MTNNGTKEENTASTTVAVTSNAPVTGETPAIEVSSNKKATSASEEIVTARIDISAPLVDAEKPQFEVYVDGADKSLKQADWMLKYENQGCVVQKEDRKVNIVIKALNDATVSISLKGKWEQDKDGKMVENWVKYTSLSINGEEILSESIAAWHNKPFRYTVNTKAGETYNIHAEWQKPDTIPVN